MALSLLSESSTKIKEQGLGRLYLNDKKRYKNGSKTQDCFNFYILQLFALPILPSSEIANAGQHILEILRNFGEFIGEE